MACIFGHKWNGCKCNKCGKTRDEQHLWHNGKCTVCSAVQKDIENEPRLSTSLLNSSAADKNFFMVIEDVFSITGRGTVVTGCAKGGRVHNGDTIYLVQNDGNILCTIILSIEQFGRIKDVGEIDENIGLLLKGVNKADVNKGDTISATENFLGKIPKMVETTRTQTNTIDEDRTSLVYFDSVIKPFTHSESLFYDSKAEAEKKEALKQILSKGVAGERYLLDFVLRDVTISNGVFSIKFYGDAAAAEWNKKRNIVLALDCTNDSNIIDKLAEILMCTGKENQFATLLQPAVAETLGTLKKYDILEKLINSGQIVPAVALAQDMIRLYKDGASEKPENIRDDNGCTPLHNAVIQGDMELVHKLLASGADIDVVCSRGSVGETALYIAVADNKIEMVKLLAENKANLSTMSWSATFAGTFPLQRAAAMGLYDIVKILVDNGADKQQKTLTGKTARMWAEQNGYADIAELLK